MKHVGWVFSLLLVTPALHALDITVGSSFTITDVSRTDGQVILPAERNKYYDIRILNKATFDFVQTCTAPCVQPLTEVVPFVQEIRPAKTRENMWLATVDFQHAWSVTFLVFKRGESYSLQEPKHFVFQDKSLQARTQEIILKAVEEMK